MKKSIFLLGFLLVLVFSQLGYSQYTEFPLEDDTEGGLKFPRSSYGPANPVWFFSLRDNNQDLWLYSLNPDNKNHDEFWNAIKLNYSLGKSIELNGATTLNGTSTLNGGTTVNGQLTTNGISKVDGGNGYSTLWLNTTSTTSNPRILFNDGNGSKYMNFKGGTSGSLEYSGTYLFNNGSLGIGTSSTPSSTNKLTVVGNSDFQGDLNVGNINTGNLVKSGDGYFGFAPKGNSWTGFNLRGNTANRIILGVANGQTSNVFDIEDADWNHMLELKADGGAFFMGNVGIGTSNTTTNKLSVNGTIRAKEIIVEATGWPDFVFEKNYNLLSLSQVENFIKENKHLPNVPSEQEITDNGVSLGEMQSKLLQKVEELTLYVIDQNKRIEKLEKENAELKR